MSKRMYRKHYYRRSFLNRQGQHGLAAVLATVDSSTEPRNFELSGTLILTDCGRKIELDFNAYLDRTGKLQANRRDLDNLLYKTNVLRTTIVDFCDALYAQIERAQDWLVDE